MTRRKFEKISNDARAIFNFQPTFRRYEGEKSLRPDQDLELVDVGLGREQRPYAVIFGDPGEDPAFSARGVDGRRAAHTDAMQGGGVSLHRAQIRLPLCLRLLVLFFPGVRRRGHAQRRRN